MYPYYFEEIKIHKPQGPSPRQMFNKSYDRYASYVSNEDLTKHNTISKHTNNSKAIQVEDLHEFKSYDELHTNVDSQPIISK